MDDLKFTTAGEYAEWYNRENAWERYCIYRDLADEGTGVDRYTGSHLLSFEQWLALSDTH